MPIDPIHKAAEKITLYSSLWEFFNKPTVLIVITAAVGIVGSSLAWFSGFWANTNWAGKGLILFWGFLFSLFILFSLLALLSVLRSKEVEIQNKVSEKSLSKRGIHLDYSYGAVIDGGTHRIYDIFGTEGIRTNLTFRNCEISGPAVVTLMNTHLDGCSTLNTSTEAGMIIQTFTPFVSASLKFFECRFENCKFIEIILVNGAVTSTNTSAAKLVSLSTGQDWN